MGNHQAIARELINEEITPQEERAYLTWAAARPPDEMASVRAYGAAVKSVFRSLEDLRQKKVEPSSAEVQALITDWNAVAVRHGLRNFMATLVEWNPVVAQKWFRVGERAMSRSMTAEQGAPDEGLWDYFGAAQEASPWHRALAQTTLEASKLAERKVNPTSESAAALAHDLTRICSDYSLGDPLVYARWAAAMQFRNSDDENARLKAAWMYLAEALKPTL